MTGPVVIKDNVVDTYTDEQTPNKVMGQKARVPLRASAGANRQGWFYFARAWPVGALIISAKLRVWNGDNWASSATLTAALATQKWSVNKIKYSAMPTVGASSAGVTKATAAPDTMWELDVTALIQTASSTGNWYGLRLLTTAAFAGWLHSTESSQGKFRPQLVVEWSETPEQPDELRPGGGRSVSLQRSTFTGQFNDEVGDNITNQQVQFGESQALLDAGTTTWDSGTLPTSAPEFNSAVTGRISDGTLWPGLADAATTAWRVRYMDTAGQWSPWSLSELIRRDTKGTLTITLPTSGGIGYDVSPVISWSLAGRTQAAYQVTLAKTTAPETILWDSGYLTGTATSVSVPFGIVDDIAATYIATVYVFDTITREATPGDPIYVSLTRNFTIGFAVVDSNVINLSVTSDPLYPHATLNWDRSGAVMPQSFVILRSLDGGVTWTPVAEPTESEAFVSGVAYTYKDVSAPPYESVQWRVVPVASSTGQMTTTYATVSGTVRRLAPFLYRPDGTDAVCFLNPKRSRVPNDVQEIMVTLSGDPVLVTQTLGLRRGKVEGRLVEEALSGVSAGELFKRFMRLRRDSGAPMMVALANETIKCVAFNFEYDSVVDVKGITYLASFEWAEIR